MTKCQDCHIPSFMDCFYKVLFRHTVPGWIVWTGSDIKSCLIFTGDKDLVQSLLFDARATNVYFDNVNIEERIEDRE